MGNSGHAISSNNFNDKGINMITAFLIIFGITAFVLVFAAYLDSKEEFLHRFRLLNAEKPKASLGGILGVPNLPSKEDEFLTKKYEYKQVGEHFFHTKDGTFENEDFFDEADKRQVVYTKDLDKDVKRHDWE